MPLCGYRCIDSDVSDGKFVVDFDRNQYDCRRADATVLALRVSPLSVPLHDQPDELRSFQARNKKIEVSNSKEPG